MSGRYLVVVMTSDYRETTLVEIQTSAREMMKEMLNNRIKLIKIIEMVIFQFCLCLTRIDTERKYLVSSYIEYYSYQYINTLCLLKHCELEMMKEMLNNRKIVNKINKDLLSQNDVYF
jgi:hypothetical protein